MDNSYKADVCSETIQNKLLTIFNDTGIDLDTKNIDEPLDLDSLHYISIICEIENEFGIEVADELLNENKLSSFKDFLMLLEGEIDNDI